MALTIDLTDQVALVTGGGAGIGQGCAVALARCGADVVLAEIDADRGAETVALVEAEGRRAVFAQTDVMETDQVRAAGGIAQQRADAAVRVGVGVALVVR